MKLNNGPLQTNVVSLTNYYISLLFSEPINLLRTRPLKITMEYNCNFSLDYYIIVSVNC